MTNINEILLRRKNKLNVKATATTNAEKAMILSIAKNIESLGFAFSEELFEVLMTFSAKELENFYRDLIPKLKRLVGADKVYNPMYPNFPEQVMEADDAELLFNAVIHYITSGSYMPEYEKDERLPLLDKNKMTVLSVGTTEDIMDIMTNLLASKTSLSGQDKADVESIISDYADYYKYLPDEIPLKENVALLCKIILGKAAIKDVSHIKKYFKTATDVLRLITALSDGDISLAKKTKYRKLKRAERRLVMNLLAGCGDITEDLFRYRYEWIRIGEIVHPFEYRAKKYKNINQAFKLIRGDNKPLMFGGMLENFINSKDMKSAANLLKKRPGEFARRLDKVLRDADNASKNYVINCFKSIANGITTPVLLQVRQHFIGRNSGNDVRVFFPKGNLARAIVESNNLPNIREDYCAAIVAICENALMENYKNREFMGKVYIASDLKNYLVPFSQRSASSSNKIIVRGSNIPISEKTATTRAFIWWTNMNSWGGRVDIDLSAAIYDENWNYVDHISYMRLRSNELQAFHSGDITNGGSVDGNGVAEFLDVNIDAVTKKGRYIVYQIYSYTGQRFSDMPNCRFGWMEREQVNSGEIFEPSTVNMSIDVTSESKVAIPVIFDCKERKFIWCDMNLGIDATRTDNGGNNLESNLCGVGAACYGMTHLNKPSLYDLIKLNAESRGILVSDRNTADIIFDSDATLPIEFVEVEDEETSQKKLVEQKRFNTKIVTPYDIDYFMGQML